MGVLNETEQFYEMLDSRFGFLNNITGANIDSIGGRHSSTNIGKGQHEKTRCAGKFSSNETFQHEFRRLMPALSVLERLFEVGVEVSRFQQEEVRQCSI